MTARLDEPQADRSTFDGALIRAMFAALALSAGLAVAWLAGGREVVLAVLAVLLAAGNGYGKAYSP